MDANRDKLKVDIAGRRVVMYRPGQGQLLALTMAEEESIPEVNRYGAFTKMFTSLLPAVDDRVWFLENLARGDYTLDQLIHTLKVLATAPSPKDRPKKSAKPVHLSAVVPEGLDDIELYDADDEDD